MKNRLLLLNAFLTLTFLPSAALATTSSDAPEALIKDGKFFGEVRYRFEHVDQDGIANDADAHTIRTNVGFKTGIYKGFQGAIEGQIVQHLSDEDFNSTTNGNTTYPVVADPDVTELNELWLSWSGLPQSRIKVGRQKINIDNQRFIGTVGWRQNDQTFDSVALTNASINNLDLMYSYVGNVNRIFGDDHTLGDLDTKTHIANVSYKFSDWAKATVYGYWMDIERAAALSNKTYGLRLTGETPINDNWTFFYEAEAATQDDYANNSASYDEKYYHVAPGIKGYGFTFKFGYEELGGDGTNAFQTPLATLHKFNGWADKFLTTPANGLEDAYIMGAYQFSNTNSIFDGTKFTALYHDFNGDEAGDYGSELDVSLGKIFALPDAGQPFKKLNVLMKYADYDAEDAPYTDTQKIWLQLGIGF